MDERDLESASDEGKARRVPPMRPGAKGWNEHWRWLAENGNLPDGVSRGEYREMVADWQEYQELEAIWGEVEE